MSYAKLLYTLPTARLREIVQRRARTIRSIPRFGDKRHLCEFLAEALSAPASIGEALESTDRLQLQILTLAIVEGGTVTFDALVARVGEEARERVWTAVNALESLGLVVLTHILVTSHALGSDRAVFVPAPVRTHMPLPLPLRRMLPSALENYDATTIGVIYQTLGLPSSEATTRAARIERITELLTDTERLREITASLGDAETSMLEYVMQRGGAVTLSEIALRLDSRQRNQLYSYDWARRWYHGKPRNAVEELLARGILVFDGAVGWGYGHILVPGNVLSALTGRPLFSGGAVELPAWENLPAEGAAIHRHESLCRDIAYLMGFLGRTEATRTAKGTIHRNVLKSLAKGLTEPTVEYSSFVYALAREADLIGPQGRGAFYDVTEQGIAWLDLPLDQQLRSLYEVWRGQAAWSENSPDPLNDSTPFYAADDTRALREYGVALMRELYTEKPDELASIRSLAGRAEFRWWSRFEPAETDEDETAQESGAAENYLSRLLAGSLYWLGLIEKAEANGTVFVRATDRGAVTLGFREPGPAPEHQTVDRFVLQPNLEIYAPPNLAPNLLYRLFRIAEPSSRAGSLLTLTADTLRRAFDRGETAKSILDLFRTHSQTGVPQNVEYLINEVGGKHGHIHIGQAGLYIQVTDPVILKEIQAQKKLNIHIRRQLTDTVALVTGDSVDAILRQLRQAGYLPVSDEERHAPTTTPAAKTRTYSPPTATRRQATQSEPRMDWDAIASEDGQPWDDPVMSSPAERASTEPETRQLLNRAAKERRVLAVRYQPDARAPSDEREIEPIGVAGSLLRAYDRTRKTPVLFNIRYITSVRTTGERFDTDS